ncbi:MAG: 1-acyl-sn-glycerol-3-phosphate acyltransferase [Gammaproteobacteria bacterium]|nr:MAG: 1-acyl-sn-glycerol-3-phosphate acyltransferase [Gammaproteobacteria bacterium]
MTKLNLFLRSLIFSIYSLTSIFLYSFVCVLGLLLPLRYRHALIRFFLRAYIEVLKKVCHIDYQVEGLEHIPYDQGGIVLSKHQSTWETFFLPLIFHDPAVIVKRELLWIPFFGWGLAISEPISINRNDKSSAMQQIIAKGKKCLAQGRWILIFPEGTRVAPGTVGHYKLGGARLAVATQALVIPVAHNAGYRWPRRRFIKRPGTIRVVIGPPIESEGRTPEEVMHLAKTWIEETMIHLVK